MTLQLYQLHQEVLLKFGTNAVSIDRVTGEIKEAFNNAPSNVPSTDIAGVLGLLQLPNSSHIVVAKTLKSVGTITNKEIYKVAETELIPLSPQTGLDSELVNDVVDHLKNANLLYSKEYNLTVPLQNQSKSKLNDEFIWNYEISRKFEKFSGLYFPCIYGVFSQTKQVINGKQVDFSVLSRRSRFRAGTRYFRRGLDSDGHAANFNESEQIFTVDGYTFAFVQIRGSVPAVWSEVINLKYKPQLRIGDLETSTKYAERHFDILKKTYGTQFLVNLVNQKGYEKPVKDVYEQVVARLNDKDLKYVYFDFHHECSKMRWHRVQLLVDELITLGLNEAGWYELANGTQLKTQHGVVRTNCMDCLDRTGVVQSTVGLHVLKLQAMACGLVSRGDELLSNTKFMFAFRNIWADNADGVSCAYSGTGALKTDFTRTGQRTKLGALRDLQNSITRYYLNNFKDGPRQDGFSVFLGDFSMDYVKSQYGVKQNAIIQTIPYLCGFCALVTVLSTLYPSQKHSTPFNIVVTLSFALVTFRTFKFIVKNGMQYVSWPTLTPVLFVQKRGRDVKFEDGKGKAE